MDSMKITVEVINVFYPAFIKAIKKCNDDNFKIKIIGESDTKEKVNSKIIEIESEDPHSLYLLGIRFATYRSEI